MTHLTRTLACFSPLLVALGIGLLFACPLKAQGGGLGLEKRIPFRVVIDAQGKLKSATPLDPTLGDEINRAAVGVAKGLAFEPARRDGAPAQIESGLVLTVRFEPDTGGGYHLALKSAALAPDAAIRESPIFPSRAVQRKALAALSVAVTVSPDGTVDRTRTRVLQTSTNKAGRPFVAEFERATLEAVARWTYHADVVAGRAVAEELRVTVSFCTVDCSDMPGLAPNAESSGLPRALEAGVQLARVPAGVAAAVSGDS